MIFQYTYIIKYVSIRFYTDAKTNKSKKDYLVF